MHLARRFHRHLAACGSLLVTAALVSGCSTTTDVPPEPPPVLKASFQPVERDPDFIPVLRYGRYTLVELAPASAQRDLMRQVVQVSIPETRKATVGEALRQILSRSGYKLCSNDDVATLSALPLPASHHRLGPLMLRDALLTLSGSAWNLSVDDGVRTICFTRFAAPDFSPVFPQQQAGSHAAGHVERRPLTTEARS